MNNNKTMEENKKAGIYIAPNIRDDKLRKYLIHKCREQKQIKHMIFITKNQKIIDITTFIR